MNKVLAFVTSILLLAGCTPEPSACILTDDDNFILAGDAVQFYNCSFDASTYLWDFGDGTTSTDKDPVHTFNTSGNFSVKLTAKSKNGKKTGISAKIITVLDTTMAAFIGTFQASQNCDNTGPSAFIIAISTSTNGIVIQNLGNFIPAAAVEINGNTITIPQQSTGNFTVSGNGTLNGNILTISYSISNVSFFETCTLTAIKQ